MAELEIHHEGARTRSLGQRVGVLAALLAVFLAVVTIASHRTHTEAIIKKSESNDQWQYYQSSRLKFHNLELGERLIAVLGATMPGASARPGANPQREAKVHGPSQGTAGESARERPKNRRPPSAARCITIWAKACWRSRWC